MAFVIPTLTKMNYSVCVLILIGLIGFARMGLTQEPAYIHYGVEEGLPSSEVYMSIQDDRGYMWFATDRGLVRFDGSEFLTIHQNGRSYSDVFFGFHRDYSGRIWFYTHKSGIGWLEGDSLRYPEFNDELKQALGASVILSLHRSVENEFWIGSAGAIPTIMVTKSGEVLELPTNDCPQPEGYGNNYLHVLEDGGIVFGRMNRIGTKTVGTNVQFFSAKGCYMVPFVDKDKKFITTTSNHAMKLRNGNYCLSAANMAFNLNKSEVLSSTELPEVVTAGMYEEESGAIWVGMLNAGAARYPNGDFMMKPTYYLQGHSVSSILNDHQQGTWFTTLDAGIYYAPDLNIKTEFTEYKKVANPVISLHVSDSFLLIGTRHGILLEKQISEPYTAQIIQENLGPIGKIQENKEFIWIWTSNPNTRLLNWRKKPIRYLKPRCYCNGPQEDSLWCIGKLGSRDVPFPDYVEELHSPNPAFKRVTASYTHDGKHYIVGGDGVYRAKGKSPNHHWEHLKKFGRDFNYTTLIITDHYSFLGTRKHGVRIHNEQTGNFWFVRKKDGLPADHINALLMQNDSTLWVGTKKGVSKIALDHDRKHANVFNISNLDGLPSNEVNALAIVNGQLWIGTKSGLAHFSLNKSFDNETAPTAQIQQVLANGHLSDTTNHTYNHDIQSFDFKFIGIDFKGGQENSYRYRLTTVDKAWSETKNREVRYILGPGDYTFEVLAGDKNGIWGTIPATYSFTILSPFWQRWWFLLIIALLLTAIVSAGFIYRTRQIRQQAQMKVSLAQMQLSLAHSQHRALTAQLKPHFLFNAINSIHNYIRKNEREKASAYLLSFSKLIRQILDNSMEPFVSVKEELEIVEKYLNVEQMRFKEKLTFSIIIDPEVNTKDWKIPSQMIQPYVENAIWHGLLPKDGEGHILIELSKKEDNLICSVDDNGVGRRAAEAHTEGDYQHESKGNRLGEERLELIRSIYKRPIKVEIVDKRSDSGQAMGTKIIMTLPIITAEA